MSEGEGDLTSEQQEVAAAPSSSRQLVTAGPGTGKTHTLIARIGRLVEHDDIPPPGILTLSFSRAAVGEVRRRLRATGEDAGRVAPITFDSFATRVLMHVDEDGSWADQSFDGRIQAAIDRIDDIGDFLEPIEHVCVDELQDLVGVRMRFVRALLERLEVGFTLLGDPAQGIYDFSLADGETAERDGAPALYAWLRSHYGDELVERSLTVNHRAKSEIARQSSALGPRVVSAPEQAAGELNALLTTAPQVPLSMLRHSSGFARTAVLCRNNGDALWVARSLRRDGIDHVLQRGATNRSVSPWVARLIQAAGGGVMNRGKFERLVDNLAPQPDDPDFAWSLLLRAARVGRDVDLDRLALRLREGGVPDELHEAPSAPIVVSTVHRAKGLEFDRVVVIDNGWRRPFDDEDARTLFVAMSRTVDTLATAELPEIGGKLEAHKWTDRWVHTGWRYWQRKGLEVKPDDVDATSPTGDGELDASEVQHVLATEVEPGTDVVLEFMRPRIGAAGAYYRVKCGDRAIGMMSERFGSDLVNVLKAKKSGWQYPRRVTGLTVDAVRSVGGDSAVAEQAGLPPGGAWLVPALVGIGEFEWSD